jgi:rod shape determining protein RodA
VTLFSIDRRSLQKFDWLLLMLTLLLVGIGLVNLLSATQAGSEGGLPSEFRRQLVALALASVALAVALFVDYRRVERLAIPFYLATLLLCASTLVLAPPVRGSQSWLLWGPLSLQPAEFAKVGLVLALARHFERHPAGEIRRLRDLLVPGLIVAAPAGIIVAQRDMGVAVLTVLIAATFLPFVRIPLRAWAVVAAGAVGSLAVLWKYVFAEYQRDRILQVIDPSRDPLASGYQYMQSKIAIGSGQLFGKPYMEGTQTQLQFLPTQHSDFIFAVLGEEWGFVGCVVVLGLYLGLLLWGLVIASNSKDGFGAMLAVGVVGMLFWPVAINVAMVIGLGPIIGVPLPLLSYGGSQMLANMIALGLLLNVSMRRYMF